MRPLNINASSCTDIFIHTNAPQRTGTHYSHTHARLHSPSKWASKKSVTMINVYCSWHFVRSSLTWMWLINRVRHKKCKATHIWRWDQQWSRAERRRAGPISLLTGDQPLHSEKKKKMLQTKPWPYRQSGSSQSNYTSCRLMQILTNKQTTLRC